VKVTLKGEPQVLPIEAVAGMIVKHMGKLAAAKAAQSSNLSDGKTEEQLFPQDWVIAIPSYYSDSQRRGLQAGCEISGIPGVLRLMHEHTAVALSYGIFKDLKKEFTKDKPTNIMFIDMGASCYTVSIVSFEPGRLVVKSSFFDENLGGRDFDDVIAKWLAEKFEEKYKGKLSAKPMDKPKVRLKLLAAAEKAKKTLSPQGVKETRINLESLMDDLDFGCSLKAEEYEEMCKPLLDRLALPIEKALAEAELQASQLDKVEIVGGSTRIGAVKRTLVSILGVQPSTTMNADEAVARGAALQSAILSPRFKVLPYEIQEAQPFPIKLSWDADGNQGTEMGGETEGADKAPNSVIMFDRGLGFPIVRRVTLKRAGEFTVTAAYDETADEFGYNQGSSKEICSFKIQAAAGDVNKVRVNVKEDIHGIIHLSSAQMVEEIEEEEPAPQEEAKTDGEEAKSEEKKKKIKKTLLEFSTVRPLDWSKQEVEKLFESEVAMANTDRIVRETSDMRNELESYIYDMRDKIISESQLAPFATDEEKSSFSAALEAAENWLYEDGFDAVKSVYAEKLAELRKIGGPIEARHREAGSRADAIVHVQRSVEHYKSWLNESQTDDKYAHITDEDRQLCHSKCDEISAWIYGLLDKQASLPLSVDPAATTAEIMAKNTELVNVCNPIMTKPSPSPKKEEKVKEKEENAKEQEKETNEKQPAESEPLPMETEGGVNGNEPEPMDTQ